MCTFPGYLIPFSLVNALHLSSFNYFHIYLFLLLFCSTFCWILAHWGNSTSALPLISTSSLTMVAACGGEKRVEVINTRKAVVQGKELYPLLSSSLFCGEDRRTPFCSPRSAPKITVHFPLFSESSLPYPDFSLFPRAAYPNKRKGKEEGGRDRVKGIDKGRE